MTWTVPLALGRGVVVTGDAPVPDPWSDAPVETLTADVLADDPTLDALVERLQRAWVQRIPTVVRWHIADDAIDGPERHHGEVHELGADHLFPHERLRFLCFTNNYDARSGELKWWWTVKAARLGVTPGTEADAVGPGGEVMWIDGGPRGPISLAAHDLVVSGEDLDAGHIRPVPPIEPPQADGLAADQLAAVGHGAGPARIIAPAGSGKTRTLTARISHLATRWKVDPSQIWAVAYNRRAADELRERIGVPGVNVRTIHALGWAILAEARPGLELISEPVVRSHLNGLLSIPKRPNSDPTGPYVEALDAVRAGLRSPEDVEAARDDVPGFADGFERYRRRIAQRGEADHGEQVYGAVEALVTDPALRARWQRRCRHLLIDEFQDLTPAYLLLLRLLASPQLQVFGVGDDDQVIYGYAGADPGFLIDYDALFPASTELALSTNYRCPPAIVTAASHLLGYNRRRIDKQIVAARAVEAGEGLEVERTPGDAMAERAAEHIASWIAGDTDSSQIAVLTRVNSSLIPIKAALVERRIGTHDLLSSEALNRTAVRALFAWIRLAIDPETMRTADVIEAIRRPSRGLTTLARDLLDRRTTSLAGLAALTARLDAKQAGRWDDFVEQLERAVDLADRGVTAPVVELVTDDIGLRNAAHTLDLGRGAARSSHRDDLVAIRRSAALHPRLDDFVEWLHEVIARPSDPSGVTLSSVHRVKGMEWHRVLVFGADRSSMPHELATDREEERRIFHVAITRARQQALVLADRSRPSRFLDELDGSAKPEPVKTAVPRREPKVSPMQTGPAIDDRVTLRGGLKGSVMARSNSSVEVRLDTGAEVVAAIADVVAVDRTGPKGDPHLAERLRDWRREKSSELGVPAFVVMHDATLEAIAARAPSSEQELAAISGIGPSKLEHYGDEILGLVATG